MSPNNGHNQYLGDHRFLCPTVSFRSGATAPSHHSKWGPGDPLGPPREGSNMKKIFGPALGRIWYKKSWAPRPPRGPWDGQQIWKSYLHIYIYIHCFFFLLIRFCFKNQLKRSTPVFKKKLYMHRILLYSDAFSTYIGPRGPWEAPGAPWDPRGSAAAPLFVPADPVFI